MYNDKKALITMMFNRLIRALGEWTFLIITWFLSFQQKIIFEMNLW